ncbi:MAG: purine nucleoside permease [Eubacteriales bacterium]|nr:purine nucleoside permease [Eubacteriales bacterium]
MKISKTIKQIVSFAVAILLIGTLAGCSSKAADQRNHVKVLILPKFEVDAISGDFPGEAQCFYDEYLAGGDSYQIDGCPGTIEVYYKDGVALCPVGQGKVTAALNTAAVLSDARFDFSEAYVLSVGCGGAAEGYGILGDVFVISAAVDFDLGHSADPREMENETETTWFHDESFDGSAVIRLDQELTDRVYGMIKDIPMETTEQTVRFLQKEYPGEDWADRQPRILRGTSVTSDNFWKGWYGHQNALLITECYSCSDPFAITEMEDIAVCQAVKRFGMLDRLIILRAAVNMDVFPSGVTPEMLWGTATEDHLASENSMESVDIFETAMRNCFSAGRVLIDSILEGTF